MRDCSLLSAVSEALCQSELVVGAEMGMGKRVQVQMSFGSYTAVFTKGLPRH